MITSKMVVLCINIISVVFLLFVALMTADYMSTSYGKMHFHDYKKFLFIIIMLIIIFILNIVVPA